MPCKEKDFFILSHKGFDITFPGRGSNCKQRTGVDDKPDIGGFEFGDTDNVRLRLGSIRIRCQNPIVFTYNWALFGRGANLHGVIIIYPRH